jgi:hypothetical protein
MQWIVVPDLAKSELSLSSLLLGLQSVGGTVQAGSHSQWSIDRRFGVATPMRFMGFVYNAAKGVNGKPDLRAMIRITRDGVQSLPEVGRNLTLDAESDTARVPFGDEIDVRKLTPGRYDLSVTVEDQVSRKSTTQHAVFFVE